MDRGGMTAFWEGARAAVPVWVGFLGITFAFGVAAHSRGLASGETLLMSAVVFAAPAQFPAIELLPTGGRAVQILLGTVFINLRFAVMSFALAPHFTRVRRAAVMAGAHFISLSTFALSFLRFQRQSVPDNFAYFLGVAIPSYACYLVGTAGGYHFGFRIPEGFGEAITFIFPAYLSALLASELREGRSILLVAVAFFLTPLVEALVPGWGLILTAVVVATGAVGLEAWWESASPSS